MQAARMARELALLERSPPPGASCWPVGGSTDRLEAAIIGPEGSPYHGGVFKLEVCVPARYPLEPPKIRFLTPVYHPNVDEAGRICLDILKPAPHGSWRPSINLSSVLTSLQLLLAEPNPDDPLVPEIADLYRFNREQFDEKAKKETEKHARQSKEGGGKRGAGEEVGAAEKRVKL
jgi:ubiquitin-conjugating enzyme E2 T